MKHDEALVRSMSPAERAILEEWSARQGPLAEACRAALRDLDSMRDVVEIGAMTDDQLERTVAAACQEWYEREWGREKPWRTEFRRGLPAAQADVLDTTEIGQQAREIRRFSEQFEAEIAKSDRSARMLVRAAELAHLYMDGKITIIEYTDEVARLGKDVTAAGPAVG